VKSEEWEKGARNYLMPRKCGAFQFTNCTNLYELHELLQVTLVLLLTGGYGIEFHYCKLLDCKPKTKIQ